MLDKLKATTEALKGAVTFGLTSVFAPREFAAEFFVGHDERRWVDLLTLVAVCVVAAVSATSVGHSEGMPSPQELLGLGLLFLFDLAARSVVAHLAIRALGGRAPFATSLQAVSFPLLTSATLAMGPLAAFGVTGSIVFVGVATLVGAFGFPSAVVSLAHAQGLRVWRAALAMLAQATVVGVVVWAAFPTRPPVWIQGLTPRRTAALEISACMIGSGEKSVFDGPGLLCARAELVPQGDGGVDNVVRGGAPWFHLGDEAEPDAGATGLVYCKCPEVPADLKRRLARARVCIESIKYRPDHAIERMRDSALMYLDAREASNAECDATAVPTHESDFFRWRTEALSWF